MAEQDQDEQVETTVDDPHAQRDDDLAKARGANPVPRVGDTWEDMTDVGTPGPQRRIRVEHIDGDDVLVENKETRHKSHVRLDRFAPPHWRFIG